MAVALAIYAAAMEWFSLVSTAVGVVLGVAATTFNDQLKWKRERTKARYESRSKLYADYLADLAMTRDALRLAARAQLTGPQTRQEAADTAFAVANIYARRYQVQITSPEPVAAGAYTTLRALNEMRGEIANGTYRADDYNAARARFGEALTSLILVMEADLKTIN